MDYSSLIHWATCIGCLLIAFLVSLALRRHGNHKWALAAINAVFLLVLGLNTTIVFLAEFVVVLVYLRILSRTSSTRDALRFILFLIVAILPLVFFKYRHLLGDCQLVRFTNHDSFWIPIGLSFYTFQLIGLMVDCRSGKCKIPTVLDAFNFAAFFPRFVAGPIERGNGLLPQIEHFRFKWDTTKFVDGLRYIILGLFFKFCMGDNLALCCVQGTTENVFSIWLSNIAFGLRIYFDFAGYGFCAYGLAKSLGVSLILNFKSPYTATNISEFWRRWHVSLTKWLVDYIYIPLGGSRTRRWALNILIVFLVSGFWHGSSWNFIAWGLICGIAMVIRSAWKRRLGFPIPRWTGLLLTWVVMFYAWMYFREADFHVLMTYNQLIFNPHAYTSHALHDFLQGYTTQFVISCFLIPLSALVIFCEALGTKLRNDCHDFLLSTPALCLQIFLLFQLSAGTSNEFIYISF